MLYTQCNILNRDSPDVDENRSCMPFDRQRTERIELHLDKEFPLWGA